MSKSTWTSLPLSHPQQIGPLDKGQVERLILAINCVTERLETLVDICEETLVHHQQENHNG